MPFLGRLLADYTSPTYNSTLFYHPDELGSLSTASDQTGNNLREMLYYPFGESWTGCGTLPMHQTFAQLPDYDNDASSDLYDTLNRHYTPSGRWLSPDPGGLKAVHTDDPQTWNMYACVRNNPTSLIDPEGARWCQVITDSKGNQSLGHCISDKEHDKNPDAYPGYVQTIQDVTVTVSGAQATDDDRIYALATGIRRAGPIVKRLAVATVAVTGLAMLPAAVPALADLTAIGGAATNLRYGVAAARALQYLGGLIVTGKLDEALEYVQNLEATPEGRELISQIHELASDLLEHLTASGGTGITPEGYNAIQQIQLMTMQTKLPPH